ncbi:MAG: ATP-binding cassette domain-containing protein [Holosporales bacterium]|jgi:ATP-binding cassette subfamily F protein 3|nr:ATP-binding cassette domain-containing protein [Holosporales bacterium]
MIIIRNLTKKFGSRLIIDNFSFQFPKDKKIAVIGANGAGKTTLLNILCGFEEHDDGDIIIPRDCTVGYLPQSPCECPKDTILNECISGNVQLCELQDKLNEALLNIADDYDTYEMVEQECSDKGLYSLEADAKGILAGLGFENSQFNDDPGNLSGGWRMRLELAKMLINNPNFIVLDEPTNHLDLPSITWLEQYLKSFKGTLLFVSHDRDFINNLADMVMHLSNANLNVYHGDFESFLEQKEEATRSIIKEKESLKKKQNQLQSFVDRFRAKASKAKQAQSKIRMIEKLKQLEDRLVVDDDSKKVKFRMSVETQSGKVVAELNDCAIGYQSSEVLLQHLDLRIIRGDKIAVIGTNGIGKSTLLKSIVGEIPFISGEFTIGTNVNMGYYEQEQLTILDPKMNALDNVMRLAPGVTHQQGMMILGCLLITKDNSKKLVGVMSGGEKSKVAMAALLARKSNFLILDEPTNHLDMSSTEALSEALAFYDGTVLTVSHNRSFINSFATHIYVVDKHNKAELVGCDSSTEM